MAQQDLIEESWNKKRIVIGGLIFIFIIGGLIAGKSYFLDKNTQTSLEKSSNKVEGASTNNNLTDQSTISLPSQEEVKAQAQEKLDSIKQQINNLNISDVASRSPQIQKVMQDLQNLQELPRNQAKDACYNFCKGL